MEKVIEALKRASALGVGGAPMADVALALVEGGVPVFPCALNKQPLTPAGFKARTLDREQIRRWWTSHSDAMPGIVPGDVGLAVLDVDSTKAHEAVRSVFENEEWDLMVETGGTSQPYLSEGVMWPPTHVYVRPQGELKIEGVVVRQHTGYVIAPGARRGDRVYKIVRAGDPTPVQVVTPKVKEKRKPADPAPNPFRAHAMIEAIPNGEDVDRERYVAMAHMIHGALGEDGKDWFLTWASKYPGSNPLEDERVWDTLPPSNLGYDSLWKTAAKYGFDVTPEEDGQLSRDFPVLTSTPPASTATPPSFAPKTREEALAELRRLLQKILDAPDDFERGLAQRQLRKLDYTMSEVHMLLSGLSPLKADECGVSLAELLQKPELLEDPPAVIPYLAWSGMKTLFSAREKTGKSTMAMAGVAAITTGADFLGVPTTRSKVLWLTEESPKILVQRAVEFGVDPEMLIVSAMGDHPPQQLRSSVDKHHPQVVVIDTLFRFAMLEDENVAGAWLPIIKLLDDISKDGAALLILAHSQKKEFGMEYRGSSAIGGYVDALLQMKHIKSTSPKVREIEGKGRLYFGKPFRVHFDGKHFTLLNQAEEVEVSETTYNDQPTKLLVLEALAAKTMKSDQVTDAVPRRRNTVLAAIKELAAEGAITKTKQGWSVVTAQVELPVLAEVL